LFGDVTYNNVHTLFYFIDHPDGKGVSDKKSESRNLTFFTGSVDGWAQD